MKKLNIYQNKLRVWVIVLLALLIFFPISGIIFDLVDRLLHYSYFQPTSTGPSQYTFDQLLAWLFVAFTNWYALFCAVYAIVFLSRIGFSHEKSEFDKFVFNIISLGTYSVIVVLVFWPDVAKQLFVGEGFIFTNSWMKNIVTVNIHFVAPAIALALLVIFCLKEEKHFKKYLLKQSWFVLLLPSIWLVYGWTRLAIMVGVHGFDPKTQTIVWWDSYKMLNPFINPGLAVGLVIVAIILIWGIAIGVMGLSLAIHKTKIKKQNKTKLTTKKTTLK